MYNNMEQNFLILLQVVAGLYCDEIYVDVFSQIPFK